MVNCVYVCVSVMAKMLHFYKFTISRRCRQAWKTSRNAMRVHKLQAVSDSLNPRSLGTMSAFGYIENLA